MSLQFTTLSQDVTMNIGPLIPIPRKRKGPSLVGWATMSAEELANHCKKWRENFGLRLDNYASLDPDSPEANALMQQWDAEGLLPSTVCWRTASGAIRRLYKAIPGTERIQLSDIKLDLRHGTGFQDVIPPSMVVDEEKGISGVYEWVPGHDPESIEVAPLPEPVLAFFKEKASASAFILNAFHLDKFSKKDAKTITLSQGARDEELYHIALTLFKGGMGFGDTAQVINVLGSQCSPPFAEKDSIKKVESAYNRFRSGKGGNLAGEVKEWVCVTPGDFSVNFCYRELGIVTPRDMASVRKALQRLNDEGVIVPVSNKKGWYRPVMKDMNRIKLSETADMGEELEIKYPFHLEKYYRTFPKSMVLVCGEPDAGKTAWLLNFVQKNIYESPLDIHYFTSEMGQLEMLDRASNIPGFDAKEWDKRVHIWERCGNFEDVIFPNGINLIDYLEIHEEHWKVGDLMFKMWNKLDKGIAIVALQQDPLKPNPKGGISAREKPRLAMTLKAGTKDKSNIMKIDKIKNWRSRLVNIKGQEFEFKLINGCTFRALDNEPL